MKKLLLLPVCLIFLMGCWENRTNEVGKSEATANSEDPLNPLGIDSTKLIEGEYLFFLNESKYPSLLKVDEPDFKIEGVDYDKIESLKQIIIDDLDSIFGLKLLKSNVFATTFSGFSVSEMSREQALVILSNTSLIASGQNNFTIQNVRARMQAPGPIPQDVRARMQEWQYDTLKRTSSKVLYVNPTLASSNSGKKIWIVDSGVDGNHSDLNVLTDPAYSVSFVNNEPDPLYDIVGHGTHCAGIAAGRAANSGPGNLGMNGASPGALVVSVKVIDWNGEGKWTDVNKAIDHILVKSESGDVVSISLGDLLPGNSNVCRFQSGILNGIKALAMKNVFVVMAAGNTGIMSTKFFPGCFNFTNVFTVGSLLVTFGFDSNHQFSLPSFSTYSNYGTPSIDYVAPGDFVFSTFPDNKYAILSGTSMATAMVAGIIHAKGGIPNGSESLNGPPSNTTYPIAKY